jgi:hypothetical protein
MDQTEALSFADATFRPVEIRPCTSVMSTLVAFRFCNAIKAALLVFTLSVMENFSRAVRRLVSAPIKPTGKPFMVSVWLTRQRRMAARHGSGGGERSFWGRSVRNQTRALTRLPAL